MNRPLAPAKTFEITDLKGFRSVPSSIPRMPPFFFFFFFVASGARSGQRGALRHDDGLPLRSMRRAGIRQPSLRPAASRGPQQGRARQSAAGNMPD